MGAAFEYSYAHIQEHVCSYMNFMSIYMYAHISLRKHKHA